MRAPRGECADVYANEIPTAILKNLHDHGEAYQGDNGIRFEPFAAAVAVKSRTK
jgi:hypothetical protein